MTIVVVALEGLDNILKQGERKRNTEGLEKNPFAEEVKSVEGAVELLKELQQVSNTRVSKTSVRIVERYFGIERDDSSL